MLNYATISQTIVITTLTNPNPNPKNMSKNKIDPNHAGWILNVTIVRPDGSLVHQSCYQLSSSVEMLRVYKEEKAKQEEAKEHKFPMFWHLYLVQVMVFSHINAFAVSSYSTEEELEFYADHESKAIAEQLS